MPLIFGWGVYFWDVPATIGEINGVSMFFSMLGSIFSGRKDYTRVQPLPTPAKQLKPYKSDAVGFNTRFSLYDIECKVQWGKPLTEDEQEFYDYIRTTQEES